LKSINSETKQSQLLAISWRPLIPEKVVAAVEDRRGDVAED